MIYLEGYSLLVSWESSESNLLDRALSLSEMTLHRCSNQIPPHFGHLHLMLQLDPPKLSFRSDQRVQSLIHFRSALREQESFGSLSIGVQGVQARNSAEAARTLGQLRLKKELPLSFSESLSKAWSKRHQNCSWPWMDFRVCKYNPWHPTLSTQLWDYHSRVSRSICCEYSHSALQQLPIASEGRSESGQ